VYEGGADRAVIDRERVRVEVHPHLVVEVGIRAGRVDVDREQAVVARLDLVAQFEVDEDQPAHVLDLTLVGVAEPVHAPNVLGLPPAVGLVGPDHQEAERVDDQGRALEVVVVELEGHGTELFGWLLAPRGGTLGLADGDGVGHDRRTLGGLDLELAGQDFGGVLGDAGIDLAAAVLGAGVAADLLAVAEGRLLEGIQRAAAGGEGKGGENGQGGTHFVSMPRLVEGWLVGAG